VPRHLSAAGLNGDDRCTQKLDARRVDPRDIVGLDHEIAAARDGGAELAGDLRRGDVEDGWELDCGHESYVAQPSELLTVRSPTLTAGGIGDEGGKRAP